MKPLPDDIILEIRRRFSSPADRKAVQEKLESLSGRYLNVGAEQLARCILIVTEGSVQKVEALFDTTFGGDPRDVIMSAMAATDNGSHWGMAAFTANQKL